MKVLVIGAGALGSLLGGLLSKEHEVTIIGRSEQVWVLEKKGLKIHGVTEGEFRPRALTNVPKGEYFDLVILCVKSYNTEVTLDPLTDILRNGASILSLQNGLDNEERILKFVKDHNIRSEVIGGITCHGVTYKGPGVIKHAGTGDTIIGHFGSLSDEARSIAMDVAEAFKHVGFDMDTTLCIDREIWAKAIINSAINPLTAIVGVRNGMILENPELMSSARDLIKEGVMIANAHGKDLTYGEMEERTVDVARRTSKNRSSMLQDLQRKRRTEVDSINGAIYEKALEVKMDAPLNRTMVRLIKAMEDMNMETHRSEER